MPAEDRWAYEKDLWASGCRLVAGVDEVGRGPLAGPVVAAAVILPPTFRHEDIKDSKLLSERKRKELAPVLEKESLGWAVAAVDEREIERINILQATLLAMARAVRGLLSRPDYLLVDAVKIPEIRLPQKAIVKGDRLSASIAAASILAKVSRDRLMEEHHERFPRYNFRRHKGYGTAEHREAISRFGPCPIHRRTFRGVREFLPR
jgi:ribonuclease HII